MVRLTSQFTRIGLFFNPTRFLLADNRVSIKTVNSVNPLQPIDLKKKLDNMEDIFLLDVREPWEFSLAAIEGSENFPQGEVIDRQQEFVFEEEIVVICHHGERSQAAAKELVESGFKKVHNLVGGIDAWSQVIDPTIPRYGPNG